MAKTAVGGDDREPDRKYGDPYAPKPAMNWAAMERTQQFLDYHFNDRRKNNGDFGGAKGPQNGNQPPYVYPAPNPANDKKKPKGY
jgi:hypothetical protein